MGSILSGRLASGSIRSRETNRRMVLSPGKEMDNRAFLTGFHLGHSALISKGVDIVNMGLRETRRE